MTLGQLFQQKRLESGRSLEQLAALTKIHIKILSAIEADDYSGLPARAFTRGFIVNYAKALRLNPDEILRDHQEFLEQKFGERLDRDKGHQGYVFEGKEIEQTRRWMVIGASAAVIFAAATLFIFKPQNHKHKEQHKEFEEEVSSLQTVTPTPTPGLLSSSATGFAALPNASVSASPGILAIPTPHLATSASATPAAKVSPTPKPTATPKPTVTATPKPTETPPKPTPTSTPISTPAPLATPVAATAVAPTASATPEASPVPTATPVKEDKLNKGDDLDAKTVKMKITFEAQEDVWVRYKIDKKPFNTLILRKGRFLAIKALDHLYFETPHAENLKFKTRGGYHALEVVKGEVGSDASVKNYDGSELGDGNFPEEIPLPRQ